MPASNYRVVTQPGKKKASLGGSSSPKAAPTAQKTVSNTPTPTPKTVSTAKAVEVANAGTPPKTVSTPEEKPAENVVSEPPPAYEPKKIRKRQSFSINSILSGEETKKENSEEEEADESAIDNSLPKDEFTQNQLQNLWQEYLNNLKKEGRSRVYNGLNQSPLIMAENYTIIIELHSETQMACFKEEKREIIKYLRLKLNNFALLFEVKMVKSNVQLEPYSPHEKYEYMVKKNPYLKEFRKRMNLDIE